MCSSDLFPSHDRLFFKDPYSCIDLFYGAFTASNRLIRNGYISIDENLSVWEISKRYVRYFYDVFADRCCASRYYSMIFRYIRLETFQLDFDSVVGKVYRFFSSVNRTLRFWRLDRYVLPEDLKKSLFKLFVSSFEYWSKKELRFLND